MFQRLTKRVILWVVLGFAGLMIAHAQTSAQDIETNLSADPRVAEFTIEPARGTPSRIKLNETGAILPLSETLTFLQSVLGFGPETTFVIESTTNTNGVQVDKFQQYTNGVKVEHGVFKSLSRKGIVLAFTAEYYNLPASIVATPSLSEAAALQRALDHVGATTYAWDYVLSLGNSPEHLAAFNELYPKGQLVFVDNYLTEPVDLRLAYKFNVYAAQPLSRADIYVDASSGDILLLDAIIKHAGTTGDRPLTDGRIASSTQTASPLPYATASGGTRYAGTRTFSTSLDANGNWVLKGITPTGVENETRSFEGIGGLPLGIPALALVTVPIADGDGSILQPETADNNWTAEEHRKDHFSATNPYPIANEFNNDDVALDAHWGAEVVLNYWKNIHNRSSYDDKGTKISNYVHYGDAYDNAFWNGVAMTYGDGTYQGGTRPNGRFAPLTSMDVCAHEIGHGVCETTSDLVYQRESGAMNEGFSDIWAAAIESYVLTQIDGTLPYDPWGIGEQIDEGDGGLPPGQAGSRALRWMDDPKANGDPDCYGGQGWLEPECGTPTLANDQCGVHTNSGVLNKWFYFLVTGSGQAFSPGFNKQPSDDLITDAGNQYHVEGLGFITAAKIAYLAETMLSPNAKYAEMREASILAAQTLYGVASNEEQQTTNAWHAVDVGDAYSAGEPNTITFNESNPQIFSESNSVSGCNDSNTYTIVITGVQISPSATISLSTAGSSATRGADFDISASSLTFNGSQTHTVSITVYDDALIEDGGEVIVLSFVYNGQFIKQEYAISDNDFAPRTGTEPIDLIETETFSVDGIPAGWSVLSLSDGVNVWRVNGVLSAEGRAYISDGISEIPFYDQLSPTNTILRSPLINATATNTVTVSFDWEAGGETDAIDPSVIFDHGQFLYSLDGSTYVLMEKFVGSGPLGVNTASGTYSAVINELDGRSFYLGWRWLNDTNAGTQFSFAIDNVKVSATPSGIETQQGESATTTVRAGNTIYFLSETDQALIAKIENASSDLGCVTLSISEGGSGSKTFSNIPTVRPSKAFGISVENNSATYDLTIYFTDEELNAFASPAGLVPMKVNSSNIDDASDRPVNFQINGVLTDVNTGGKFRAYTGTFSGSGSASVVQQFVYCTTAPAPWVSADVGTVSSAGTLCYKNGIFEISASGAGIEAKADAFYFTYQQITGDGEVIARVNSLENTSNTAKAGVMIRQTLDANSPFAMTAIVSNPLLLGTASRFEYRKTPGAKAAAGSYRSMAIPEFVRIVRSGNSITSYVSETNGSWQQIGSASINFANTIYVGLAATSDAEFNDVSVAGSPEQPISARMGTQGQEMEENSEESDYVVFPNPALESVSIEIPNSNIKTIAIYNTLGQLVKEQHLVIPAKRTQVDVSRLEKGLFIMKVFTEKGQMPNRRLLKE